MESHSTADASSSDVDALGQSLDHQLRLISKSPLSEETEDGRRDPAITSKEPENGVRPPPPPLRLICDLGYGLPKENRPRNEKIRAIARQLVNFLRWRTTTQNKEAQMEMIPRPPPDAPIWIVLGSSPSTSPSASKVQATTTNANTGTTSNIQQILLERMKEVWHQLMVLSKSNSPSPAEEQIPFPDSMVSFTESSLEEFLCWQDDGKDGDLQPRTDNSNNHTTPAPPADKAATSACYLSPDAAAKLDPHAAPPQTAVIGLLIDRRRIQRNRSAERATSLRIPCARWPLEECIDIDRHRLHCREPLNVDTVLEGMQQWHWNYYYPSNSHCCGSDDDDVDVGSRRQRRRDAFRHAATQALRHHQERHPERPWHLVD